MNWAAIGFDWNHARSFLATAREGSLSAAARALGTTQPTIGRQIDALEAALGVILFERGRRGLTLTAAGKQIRDEIEAMALAASAVSLVAARQSQDLAGEVSVTAVDLVARAVVVPVARRLSREAPGLSLRIVASDAVQDLGRREADIAIRHILPKQGDLVARLAAKWRASLWASKDLLARCGRPQTAAELVRLPFVGAEDTARMIALAAEIGVVLEPRQFIHPASSGVVALDLVRAGLGMSFLPDALCAPLDDLERLDAVSPPFTFPVWLVAHRELQASPRIRLVFDALAEAVAALERGETL